MFYVVLCWGLVIMQGVLFGMSPSPFAAMMGAITIVCAVQVTVRELRMRK